MTRSATSEPTRQRIVYCGTPDDAVPPLRALHEAGHDIAMVVTQPERRRGRGAALVPSPVHEAAGALGLEVRTPTRAREIAEELADLGADLGVVVAFGQLLPPSVLDATRLGYVNLHFSLLPRWRGAAPVERALLAGDTETGVCVMQLDEGMDTGPVYACEHTSITADETAGELRARLVELGTPLLVRTVANLDPAAARPQDGEATHAAKLTVEEFRIDPHRPADELARVVRAGNPRPGAWTTVAGQRFKILRAHAIDGDGSRGVVDEHARVGTAARLLVLDEVQPAGRSVMSGPAWRAGVRDATLSIDS